MAPTRPIPSVCRLQVGQVRLQARGREQAGVAAELGRVERELEKYVGLPPDAEAARAATQQKRQELEGLRRQLQQHLDDIQ